MWPPLPVLLMLALQIKGEASEPVVGRLFIRFVRYDNDRGVGINGHCCDGKFGVCEPNGCDHTFRVCVDKASGLSGSVSSCHYITKQSSEISNREHVVFGDAFGNVRNPIVVDLKKIPDFRNVSLKVDVWDDDGKFSDPDHVDTLRSMIQVSPVPKSINGSSGPPVNRIEIKHRTRLSIEWYTLCAENRYGSTCAVVCVPSSTCRCDPFSGRQICKTDCESPRSPCASNPCLPGGCINNISNYTCVCPCGYEEIKGHNGKKSCLKMITSAPSNTTTPRPIATTTTPEVEFIDRRSADCHSFTKNNNNFATGIYTLHVSHFPAFTAFCEVSNGRAYTVIQRRYGPGLNFRRSWAEYERGFGYINYDSNFFLGLEKIYWLTNQRRYELVVYVKSGGRIYKAYYSEFRIEKEANNYRLHVSGYNGTLGDSLSDHNGAPFSTYDRDNDGNAGANCASRSGSGWWFYSGRRNGRECFTTNLNGRLTGCRAHPCARFGYKIAEKTEMRILPNPQ